jgi:hypothetical protein
MILFLMVLPTQKLIYQGFNLLLMWVLMDKLHLLELDKCTLEGGKCAIDILNIDIL